MMTMTTMKLTAALPDADDSKCERDGGETRKEPKGLRRRSGRSPRGYRATTYVDMRRGKSYSALGVMVLNGGIIDSAISESTGVDVEEFLLMLETCVLPHVNEFPAENSIVVLDNARIHKDPKVRALVEGVYKAKLVYLPAYANFLNPIEEGFSKVKLHLQRHRDEVRANPKFALETALLSVNAKDAAGYYRHAGYNVEVIVPAVGGVYHGLYK